jgi:hypothetical protein
MRFDLTPHIEAIRLKLGMPRNEIRNTFREPNTRTKNQSSNLRAGD